MSLFGSLFTGVSGLNAQSQATSMISNNIANVNTVGFKRSEAAFFSLVTTESRGSRYSPGTVAVNRIQRVDQQGPIQQSVSSTDVSISGNGFFVIKRDALNLTDSEYLYTRNGQFSEDAQGYLRNSAGFYLYGWPLDADGNLPSAQGDLSSLRPVDVAFLGGLTRPTTTSELAITLNSAEEQRLLDTTTNLLAPGSPPDFTRSQVVYDSLGEGQTVTYEFSKVYGPQATDISTAFDMELGDELVADVGLTAGHAFGFQVGTSPAETFTITASSTMNDLIAFINDYGSGNEAEAFLNEDGELVIQSVLLTDDWTLFNAASANSGALTGLSPTDALVADVGLTATHEFDFVVGANPPETFQVTGANTVQDLIDFINNYNGGDTAFASLNADGQLVIQANAAYSLTNANPGDTVVEDLGFTSGANVPLGTPITTLGFASGTPVTGGAALPTPNTDGTFPDLNYPPGSPQYNGRGWWQVSVRAPSGVYLTEGLINFNGDGSINAIPDASGNTDIELSQIDWGNGSNLQNISVDISRFSQFAGNYNVISADQNGAELGLRTGVEIDRNGFVIAQFSNGATARLYKLPMVTFSNPNGLQEVSGTAYTKTEESGEENLREAGRGGAGFLETSTVEVSNVDLADEFAKLIISQRAYSANTKIINTVDQMTEELLRLR